MSRPHKISAHFFNQEALECVDRIALSTLEWAVRRDSIYKNGEIKLRKGTYIQKKSNTTKDERKEYAEIAKAAEEIEKILDYKFDVNRSSMSDIGWLEEPSILKTSNSNGDAFVTQHNLFSLRIALDAITHHVGSVFAIQIAHHLIDFRNRDQELGRKFTHPRMKNKGDDGIAREGLERRVGDVLFASHHEYWVLIELLYREFMDARRKKKLFSKPIGLDELWQIASTKEKIGKLRNLGPEVRTSLSKLDPCLALGMIVQLQHGERSRFCIGPSGFAFMQRVHKPLAGYIAGRMLPPLNSAAPTASPEAPPFEATLIETYANNSTVETFQPITCLGPVTTGR